MRPFLDQLPPPSMGHQWWHHTKFLRDAERERGGSFPWQSAVCLGRQKNTIFHAVNPMGCHCPEGGNEPLESPRRAPSTSLVSAGQQCFRLHNPVLGVTDELSIMHRSWHQRSHCTTPAAVNLTIHLVWGVCHEGARICAVRGTYPHWGILEGGEALKVDQSGFRRVPEFRGHISGRTEACVLINCVWDETVCICDGTEYLREGI